MAEEIIDKKHTPPFWRVYSEVMVDHPEPMLFSALMQISENSQFSNVDSQSKSRVFRHLSELYGGRK